LYKYTLWYESITGINHTSYRYCQYCISPRYNLVSIYLLASDTIIHICPLRVCDLFRLPIHFAWWYTQTNMIGTTAVYIVLTWVSLDTWKYSYLGGSTPVTTDVKNQVTVYGSHYYSQCSDHQNADFTLLKLIKHTNLDIKNAGCLRGVHILQHPTSCQTTKSTQCTMAHGAKTNLSPLPVGESGKWTKWSRRRHHVAIKWKHSVAVDKVRAFGALRSLQSKKKFLAEKWWQTHIVSNKEQEKWIEDYVNWYTAA